MTDSNDPTLSSEDLLALVDMGRELGAELDLRALLSRILARALDPECSLDSLSAAEQNRAPVTVCQRIKEALRSAAAATT